MYEPIWCEARVPQRGSASATTNYCLYIILQPTSHLCELHKAQGTNCPTAAEETLTQFISEPPEVPEQAGVLAAALEGLSRRWNQVFLSISKARGKLLSTDSFLLGFLAINLWLPSLALLFSQRKPMTLEPLLLPESVSLP